MLISFSVENFKSIKDPVVLSMVPDAAIREHDTYVINTGDTAFPSLLPVEVIYGLNGSGKSTLLKAVAFMKQFVLSSAKESTLGDKIGIEPFLLDKESAQRATTFSIEFFAGEIRYFYKFAVTTERVVYETLHAFPNGVRQVWFERFYAPTEPKKYIWKFSFANYRGAKSGIGDVTLENTLYLSKAVMNADEQLREIHNFFSQKLFVSYGHSDGAITYDFFGTPEGQKKIIKFLKAADLGIDNITVEKKETSYEHIPAELRGRLPPKMTYFDTKTHHIIPGTNESVTFSLERNESSGAVKMFKMAGLFIRALSDGGTLLVDELEQGLHFKLQCYLISLFNKGKYNSKHAQLIFTTHSPLILDKNFLRRDQVWFTSKTEQKNTDFYSLVDVPKHVKDAKPVRKGQDLVRGFVEGKFYDPPKYDPNQLWLFEEN